MRSAKRSGGALLEVLAAMTLLMISGLAGASLLAQVAHSVEQAESMDAETAAASAVLGRVSLWSRERLIAAGGETLHSGFLVSIALESPLLFRIAVMRVQNRATVLTTIVYRSGGDAPQ